jgi:hypothetical protein
MYLNLLISWLVDQDIDPDFGIKTVKRVHVRIDTPLFLERI